MEALNEVIQDMKTEEKTKNQGRLRIVKDAVQRLKEKNEQKKAERAEAVKLGASLTSKELKKQKKEEAKPKADKVRTHTRAADHVAEDKLYKRYAHIVKGSIGFDPKANKGTCTINCQHKGENCEKTRGIYTSDAFQVTACRACLKEMRNQKRNKSMRKAAKKHGSVNKARKVRKQEVANS